MLDGTLYAIDAAFSCVAVVLPIFRSQHALTVVVQRNLDRGQNKLLDPASISG
jgi:hypothetical protein